MSVIFYRKDALYILHTAAFTLNLTKQWNAKTGIGLRFRLIPQQHKLHYLLVNIFSNFYSTNGQTAGFIAANMRVSYVDACNKMKCSFSWWLYRKKQPTAAELILAVRDRCIRVHSEAGFVFRWAVVVRLSVIDVGFHCVSRDDNMPPSGRSSSSSSYWWMNGDRQQRCQLWIVPFPRWATAPAELQGGGGLLHVTWPLAVAMSVTSRRFATLARMS